VESINPDSISPDMEERFLPFTAKVKLIREIESEGSRGLVGGLAALRGLGISIGGSTAGLTPDAFPQITTSREDRLA